MHLNLSSLLEFTPIQLDRSSLLSIISSLSLSLLSLCLSNLSPVLIWINPIITNFLVPKQKSKSMEQLTLYGNQQPSELLCLQINPVISKNDLTFQSVSSYDLFLSFLPPLQGRRKRGKVTFFPSNTKQGSKFTYGFLKHLQCKFYTPIHLLSLSASKMHPQWSNIIKYEV